MNRALKVTGPPEHSYSDRHWQVVQVGIVSLPFSPLVGCVCVVLTALVIWQQQGRQLWQNSVTQGFAVLSGWMIFTCGVAFKPELAWVGLANFLPFFLVFPALSQLIQTPMQLRRIAWLLVLTSVPVSLIGWAQLYGGWSGQVEISWLLLKWTIDPTGNPPGRMSSIFSYATVLASYLVTVFILGLGLWLETLGAQRRSHSCDPVPPHWCQISLGLITLLNAISLVLTNSRNAWAIALLACLGFALYYGWRWIVGGVMAIASIVMGAAFAPPPLSTLLRVVVPAFFWARLNDQMYRDRPFNQLRSTQWQFAGALTQQRPLTGWGLRNFTPLYEAQMHLWLGHPHSLIMMMAAETGIPGAVMLFGLVGWVLAQGVWLWHKDGLTIGKVDMISTVDQRGILGIFLIAFFACTLFSFLDVTFFDVRVNLINWIILSSIRGIVQTDRRAKLTSTAILNQA